MIKRASDINEFKDEEIDNAENLTPDRRQRQTIYFKKERKRGLADIECYIDATIEGPH